MMVTLMGVASPPDVDAFDRALAALTAGNRAAVRGDRAHLRAAALMLLSSGARPVAEADMATLWLERAHAQPPPATRDRALGPGYRSLRLNGGDAAAFKQTFLAGQRARVAVVPLRRSSFAMRVHEDASAPVCSGSQRRPQCDWVPAYTTRFTIEVSNSGNSPGQYILVMQ